jgi:hypothetical protein
MIRRPVAGSARDRGDGEAACSGRRCHGRHAESTDVGALRVATRGRRGEEESHRDSHKRSQLHFVVHIGLGNDWAEKFSFKKPTLKEMGSPI